MDAMIENVKNSFEVGVKKVISSGQRKENLMNNSRKAKGVSKIFGASLCEICQHENSVVPYIVEDICNYIQENFIDVEGIFRTAMKTWPEPHQKTLQRVLVFLQPIIRNARNRMTATGIAVVFGPNLFRIPSGTIGLEVQALANSAFERLLRASDVICNQVKDDQGYLKVASSLTPPVKPARVAPPVPKPARPLPPPPVASDDMILRSVTPPRIPQRSKSLIHDLDNDGTTHSNLLDPCSASECSDGDNSLGHSWDEQSRDLLGKTISSVVRKRLFTADSSSSEEASSLPCDQNASVTSLLPSLTSGRNNGPRRRKPTRSHVKAALSESMIPSMTDAPSQPVPKPRKHHQMSFTAFSDTSITDSSEVNLVSRSVSKSNIASLDNKSGSKIGIIANDVEAPKEESQSKDSFSEKSSVIPPLDLSGVMELDVEDPDTTSQPAPRKKRESPARLRRRQKANKSNQVNTSPKSVTTPIIAPLKHDEKDDVTSETADSDGSAKWRDAWSTDEEGVSVAVARSNIDEHEAKCHACSNSDDGCVLSSSEDQTIHRHSPYMQRRLRRNRKDGNRTSPKSTRSSSDLIIRSLQMIMEELERSRKKKGRPEDVTLMTREEIKEEKLAMQKELLKYEEKHGRPSSKQDREIMRSLYERYRTVKRLLADSMHPPFQNISERRANDADDDYDVDMLESSQEITMSHSFQLNETSHSESRKDATVSINEGLDVLELQHQQAVAKGEKKRLKRKLKEFENEIELQYGRRITPADKVVMASEYQGYKDLSAKIRLLGALIEKLQSG